MGSGEIGVVAAIVVFGVLFIASDLGGRPADWQDCRCHDFTLDHYGGRYAHPDPGHRDPVHRPGTLSAMRDGYRYPPD